MFNIMVYVEPESPKILERISDILIENGYSGFYSSDIYFKKLGITPYEKRIGEYNLLIALANPEEQYEEIRKMFLKKSVKRFYVVDEVNGIKEGTLTLEEFKNKLGEIIP